MKHGQRFILCLLFTLQFLCCGIAPAQANVAELQRDNRLQVRTWLEPAIDIVPGQQIKLTLEIATDRWFAGGTRIQIPEVPGLVIIQSDNFAANATEQRAGQSWVIQRWTLEVYPQREGNFLIPGVVARVKINDSNNQVIEGEVTGPGLTFAATVPQALQRIEQWVAAPEFTVSQRFDRELTGLIPGDALEREVIFEANEVMAMMLPTFDEQPISGLTAYPESPTLQNTSNRGTLVASRRTKITYIVEQAADYQLPAQDYFWWDTESGELQLISLPPVLIEAANGARVEEQPDAADYDIAWGRLIPWAASALLLTLLLWFARKLPYAKLQRQLSRTGNRLIRSWRKFRQPALPTTLNPGSNAAD